MPLSAAQLAHQARRHGYHAPDRYTAYVICPRCRSKVYADPARVGGRSGDDRAVSPALDAAMIAHLPHCTAVSSFEDDAAYGAGWNEPPVNLSRTV